MKDPFSTWLADQLNEVRAHESDAHLRRILDTADEIEAKTGVRPDVRKQYAARCLAVGLPVSAPPEWFR